MNQFFERFESTLKQSLRVGADDDAAALSRYILGCLHQYAKSGFAKKPGENFSAQRRYLLA